MDRVMEIQSLPYSNNLQDLDSDFDLWLPVHVDNKNLEYK